MTAPDYRGFAKAILDGWPEPYGDSLDGCDLQDIAFEHGVLIREQKTVPCSTGDNVDDSFCNCSEYCDEGEVVDCYRLAPDLEK